MLDSAVAYDWTGNQLRKKGLVERKIEKIALHRDISAAQIDQVRHRLERKKGNPDWKVHMGHVDRRNPERDQRDIQVFDQEICVLEDGKREQVADDAQDKYRPSACLSAPAVQRHTDAVVEQNRTQHDQHEQLFFPGVKQQARRQQNGIFQLTGYGEIPNEYQWQKQE